MLPLLFRARRTLIIGDPTQLRHIATISPEREASARRGVGISADWLEERQLSYRRHSAFHALERAQADRIARYWDHEPQVRVGTVHTFQGGERDVVVFGLVAGASMPAGSTAWLEAERNLWNVAISRARVHLVLVG